ncbi:hypothetical protein ACWEQL_12260 [Kitasatospora sp. NPDC004240]
MAGGTGKGGPGNGEFTIKPWEVHGEGREFEKISGEYAKAAAALEQKLAALGTPWGLDRPGTAFAAVYGEAHGSLVGGLHGLAGRLGQVGTGLHTMAERTVDADTTAASGFGAGAGSPGAGKPGGGKAGPASASA